MSDEGAITHYLSTENERSLYNLSPKGFQRALERVTDDLLEMPEEDLARKIKPTPVLNSLRFRIWDEFTRAVDLGNRLKTSDLCRGICTEAYFLSGICRNPTVVAWLAHPPRSYETAAEEALNFGITRLRDMLEHSFVNEKGKINVPVAKLQVDIVKMLDARQRGAPVQRHEIRQRTLAVTRNVKSVEEKVENMSMADLEKRLKQLRKEETNRYLPEEPKPALEKFQAREVTVEDAEGVLVKEEKEF